MAEAGVRGRRRGGGVRRSARREGESAKAGAFSYPGMCALGSPRGGSAAHVEQPGALGQRRSRRHRWACGPSRLPPETGSARWMTCGVEGGGGGPASRRSRSGSWVAMLALTALSCAPGATASVREAIFSRSRGSQSGHDARVTSQELVLATWNPQKLRELAELSRILHVKTFPAEQFGLKPPAAMPATAAEDSEAKASAVARAANRAALADCAVLLVPALNNAPGLHAANIVQNAGGWEV
jgi:hypothetical protein